MRLVGSFFTLATLWLLVAGEGSSAAARLQKSRQRREDQLREHFKRHQIQTPSAPVLEERTSPFLNSKSKPFEVNGTALPDVDFDVGESYAGLLPISDHPDETRKLYFWFFPSTNQTASQKEITIWLQGGPGAASTGGLLLENGPLLSQPGTIKPYPNAFSWNNLTNMVWVDQPVGTGWSVGTPNVTNDYQVADQFMGFFKNFVDTFAMQGYKVYLAGESYAGYYIPYIANGFIEANDTEYFNFKGAAINDPIIGNAVIQFNGVAMQYVNTWAQVFGFTPAVMAKFNAQNEKCGYVDYLNKYFTFPPPPAPFPGPFGNKAFGETQPNDCNIQNDIINSVTTLNPCFNEDHIFDTCPIPYSALGAGLLANFNPSGPEVWYNRPEVKAALHAPNITWEFVTNTNVYVGPNTTWEVAYDDASFPPAQIGIVSRMIEATNNIIVGVGGLDFQLPANGTLLVFQNMTWNGGQGFSAFPNETLFVPNYPQGVDGQLTGTGDMGTWTSERGLTFYISHWAGHEDPWYTPGVAYRVVQTMLGRIPNLSDKGDF